MTAESPSQILILALARAGYYIPADRVAAMIRGDLAVIRREGENKAGAEHLGCAVMCAKLRLVDACERFVNAFVGGLKP